MKKQYQGSVYIGVTGSETENGQCYDSIMQLHRRPGDVMQSIRATKGFEARQQHFNNFIESKCDFMFLMDADMIFPENTLERLRGHERPFVSGLYMRRMYAPIAPIWFMNAARGQMPLKWWTGKIAPNALYAIGASGWGCMLIYRDVVVSTRAMLKGEADVIEDDMDVYPYDLSRISELIRRLDEMRTQETIDRMALGAHVDALKAEIRPLRVIKSNVGSDVRYPFFAKLAGWQLMGDSGAPCGHMLNYPLKPSDYLGMQSDYAPAMTADLSRATNKAWTVERQRINAARAAL